MEIIKTKELGNKNLTIVKFDYGYECQLTNEEELLDADGFYDNQKDVEVVFNNWIKELILDKLN